MPRTIYNEGRVVGYSAYEIYVRHARSEGMEPVSEKEWLAASLTDGSSLLMRLLPTMLDRDGNALSTAGAHIVDIPLPIAPSRYELTTREPNDWTTRYTSYYTRSGTDPNYVYTQITTEPVPVWEAHKYFLPVAPTWVENKYYTYVPPEGRYYLLTSEPANWSTAWGTYYETSDGGQSYYHTIPDYELSQSQPIDWATDWKNYYTRSGASPDYIYKQATSWKPDTYYRTVVTHVVAANTIVGSLFLGSGVYENGSYWASHVGSYGQLLNNAAPLSTETYKNAEEVEPYSNINYSTPNEIEKFQMYTNIVDGDIITSGTWSPNATTPPGNDFVPDLSDSAQQQVVRLYLQAPITIQIDILLTGFMLKSILTLDNLCNTKDGSVDTLNPEDGDFLGPAVFPWSNKIIFSLPPASLSRLLSYTRSFSSYHPLTTAPSDWNSRYYAYYQRQNGYVETVVEPSSWNTIYKQFYTKSGDIYVPVTGNIAPTWEPSTYYAKSRNGYIALNGIVSQAPTFVSEEYYKNIGSVPSSVRNLPVNDLDSSNLQSYYETNYIDSPISFTTSKINNPGVNVLTVYPRYDILPPALYGTKVQSTGDTNLYPVDVVAPGTVKIFTDSNKKNEASAVNLIPGNVGMYRDDDYIIHQTVGPNTTYPSDPISDVNITTLQKDRLGGQNPFAVEHTSGKKSALTISLESAQGQELSRKGDGGSISPGPSLSEYRLLTEQPDDWTTNYSKYFTHSGLTYPNVVGTHYKLMTEPPTDWTTNWSNYYTRGGTPPNYIYDLLASEPIPTWQENTYYAAVAPTWQENTYYTYLGSVYVLQTSRPDDWTTNWRNYYEQYKPYWSSEFHYRRITPSFSLTTYLPVDWGVNWSSYFVKSSATDTGYAYVTTGWYDNTYYKYVDDLVAPTWEQGIYYTRDEEYLGTLHWNDLLYALANNKSINLFDNAYFQSLFVPGVGIAISNSAEGGRQISAIPPAYQSAKNYEDFRFNAVNSFRGYVNGELMHDEDSTAQGGNDDNSAIDRAESTYTYRCDLKYAKSNLSNDVVYIQVSPAVSYNTEIPPITEFQLLTTRPNDWDDDYTSYYTRSLNADNLWVYANVPSGPPIPGYTDVSTSQNPPSDWNINRTNYYARTGTSPNYTYTQATALDTWEANKYCTWITDTYYVRLESTSEVATCKLGTVHFGYSAYGDSIGVCYNKTSAYVSAVTDTIESATEPSDWDDNRGGYFRYNQMLDTYIKATDTDIWAANMYYTKPENWDTTYYYYYLRSGGEYVQVPQQPTPPTWNPNSYYARCNKITTSTNSVSTKSWKDTKNAFAFLHTNSFEPYRRKSNILNIKFTDEFISKIFGANYVLTTHQPDNWNPTSSLFCKFTRTDSEPSGWNNPNSSDYFANHYIKHSNGGYSRLYGECPTWQAYTYYKKDALTTADDSTWVANKYYIDVRRLYKFTDTSGRLTGIWNIFPREYRASWEAACGLRANKNSYYDGSVWADTDFAIGRGRDDSISYPDAAYINTTSHTLNTSTTYDISVCGLSYCDGYNQQITRYNQSGEELPYSNQINIIATGVFVKVIDP